MRKVLLGLWLLTLLLCVSPGTAAAQVPQEKSFATPVAGTSPGVITLTTPATVAAASDTTLLSDDYESGGKWNSNSSGWATSTTRAYGGTDSAHAPSSGLNPLMIYGPFDLSHATAATLSFQLWYYAPKASFPPGTQNTAGAFLVGYSTNGSVFTFPYQWSGSTSGEWWYTEFDLGSWSLLGQPQVWIALGTTADASALYSEGAYVDDLSLTATVPDTTPPTTTATGALTGRWYRDAVTVTLSAADNAGGSGVDYTEYSLDGGSWTKAGSVPVSAQGFHTLLYRSADLAGNAEAQKGLSFGIDTVRPTTKAPYAATAYRGRTAVLKCRVFDPQPNGGTATVTIRVENARRRVVAGPYGYRTEPVNKLLALKFTVRRTLTRGTYRFYVYAMDKAGNTQTLPAGSNKLVVK